MPDEQTRQTPSRNPDAQTPTQTPNIALPQQSIMTNDSKQNADNVESETKKKLHWLEIGYFSSQIVLAVIGVWALTIYHGQLVEMRKSTDASTMAAKAAKNGFELSRNSLKATNAGIIVPNLWFQQGSGVVNVVMENRGKGNAWGVTATYRVSLISLPKQTVIVILPPRTSIHPVPSPAEGPNDFTILPKYTRDDLLCFNNQQEAVRVEGDFRYDNSFEKMVNEPFCLIAMVGNTIPCADLQMRLRVNSDPFGLNVPPAPQKQDCHQKL